MPKEVLQISPIIAPLLLPVRRTEVPRIATTTTCLLESPVGVAVIDSIDKLPKKIKEKLSMGPTKPKDRGEVLLKILEETSEEHPVTKRLLYSIVYNEDKDKYQPNVDKYRIDSLISSKKIEIKRIGLTILSRIVIVTRGGKRESKESVCWMAKIDKVHDKTAEKKRRHYLIIERGIAEKLDSHEIVFDTNRQLKQHTPYKPKFKSKSPAIPVFVEPTASVSTIPAVTTSNIHIAKQLEEVLIPKVETPSSRNFTLTYDECALLIYLSLSKKMSGIYDLVNRPLSTGDKFKIKEIKEEIIHATITQEVLTSLRRKFREGLMLPENRKSFIDQNEKSWINDLLKIIYEISPLYLNQFTEVLIPPKRSSLPINELG